MQPSSSDGLRPSGSFSNEVSSAKSKTNHKAENNTLSFQSDYALQPCDNQEELEIRRLFGKLKLSISSLVDELHGRETTISGLLIELLIGAEVVTYELDDEITKLCAVAQRSEPSRDANLEESFARRASALSRIRHRILVLERSIKLLVETASTVLEQYGAVVHFRFEPFAMEGKGVTFICGEFLTGIESDIDGIASAASEAVKKRDFHGGALLAALGSNLSDFVADLRPLVTELPTCEKPS